MEGVKDISTLHIFTDGSVNVKTGVGAGAILVLSDVDASVLCEVDFKRYRQEIKIDVFKGTSSTRLELQAQLSAMSNISTYGIRKIVFYTDSQNILSLLSRRTRLEALNFFSKKGKRLANAELYQQFYVYWDGFVKSGCQCEWVKLAGHLPDSAKNTIDQLFSLVDKAARQANMDLHRKLL
ncbi:ribonuclease HI [Teredinibacter purpureus]|uniref:ribonuclease HI n=1 Tax=Teredinibacter purpureus TaxID=2731756 RepID=UPI0005F88CCF|nr:RNase H family protein [Teredinibacter purpureus]